MFQCDWNIRDSDVNVTLARTSHRLWAAICPDRLPVFGRWVRGHSGDLLNDRADVMADRGTRGESTSRRRTRWRDVEAAVDALRAAHHAIGTHAIDLPPQTIYQLLLDVHRDTVACFLSFPAPSPRHDILLHIACQWLTGGITCDTTAHPPQR